VTRLADVELAGLVPGGDRALVEQVLADPRLAAVARLQRGPLLAIPDPKGDVLGKAAQRAHAVRIHLDQPTA
jgi:hypothetical protein